MIMVFIGSFAGIHAQNMETPLKNEYKKTFTCIEEAQGHYWFLLKAMFNENESVFHNAQSVWQQWATAWNTTDASKKLEINAIIKDDVHSIFTNPSLVGLQFSYFSQDAHILSCVTPDNKNWNFCETRNPMRNGGGVEISLIATATGEEIISLYSGSAIIQKTQLNETRSVFDNCFPGYSGN